MPTTEERIAVLETEIRAMREQLGSLSRNMWGVVLAVAGLLGKFVLDRLGTPPVVPPPKEAAIAAVHFVLAIIGQ